MEDSRSNGAMSEPVGDGACNNRPAHGCGVSRCEIRAFANSAIVAFTKPAENAEGSLVTRPVSDRALGYSSGQ